MSDDILDSIGIIIGIMILGVIVVIIGLYLQSIPIILLGGILIGAVPILKLVIPLLERL